VWLVIVAALWGGTNPFLKSAGRGITAVKQNNFVLQFLAELFYLPLNWRYMVPFVMNQTGSVVYYLTLASVDLSLAVPITNSLTFLFTALSGRLLLGEQLGTKNTCLGASLVLAGVSLCVISKLSH